MPLIGTLSTISLYISLNSRPHKGEYHWGLVVTDSHGQSTLHHASNRTGPWQYEQKSGDPGRSMTLIAVMRISSIKSQDVVDRVIKSIPANGSPSRRTGEAFTCRIWVKDALVALHENGAIVLPTDIESVEEKAIECGLEYANVCENGGGATVVNDPFDLGQG